ncbi:MAG: RNA-binding protein [Alphaproteobacteria bacterium]|nr:RNA-binding protein [Alphaproteobacteria bacterium]
MPKGPRGEKRPADVIGAAIKVARIATGEEQDDMPAAKPGGPTASEMGKKGGAARAKSMSPERRAEIAKKAAASRWKTPK